MATIGNFDGVPLGHQAIMGRLVDVAASLNLPSIVVLFEPHPIEFFSLQEAPARLMRLREKLQKINKFSVDRVLCVRFKKQFSSLTAQQFIDQVLVGKLSIKHLLIGDDFRFGAKRQGNFDTLKQAGVNNAFYVESIDTIDIEGERISSTKIRQLLELGDLEKATQLLGQPYYTTGRVFHGEKRGRQIGYPTANIPLFRHLPPINGVFAIEARINDGTKLIQGVANIGKRPTVDGRHFQLEAHLFNFNDDIYRQLVTVQFIKKLRDEKKFDTISDLKSQIEQDVQQAKQFFTL